MSSRIGRRARHRRHKASTKRRRLLRLNTEAAKRLLRAMPARDSTRACLLWGGPMHGELRDVGGRTLRVAQFADMPAPDSVADFLKSVFAHADVRTVTYVCTREARTRYASLWVMQPTNDAPVGEDFDAWPDDLRRRILDVLVA